MAMAVDKARNHISSLCIDLLLGLSFPVKSYESSIFDIHVTFKGAAVKNIHHHCISENYIGLNSAH